MSVIGIRVNCAEKWTQDCTAIQERKSDKSDSIEVSPSLDIIHLCALKSVLPWTLFISAPDFKNVNFPQPSFSHGSYSCATIEVSPQLMTVFTMTSSEPLHHRSPHHRLLVDSKDHVERIERTNGRIGGRAADTVMVCNQIA
ncbi:hypothetical protein WN48_02551 [Eufriesea mexicana]|uniref:Uncharacterized protein n=1 Tax=Eufriesea mexicana TaxID=516756 RepID=A0A310SU89_9HYME|nr:hypothetical protein WN48_02551 [Eufriesea mexicana]